MSKTRPTTKTTFRIDPFDKKTLEELAKSEDMSVGKLINRALAEYAATRKREWIGTGSWGGERRGSGVRRGTVETES